MPYCPSCGEAVDGDDSFCHACGESLTEPGGDEGPSKGHATGKDPKDMTNEELLEAVAELDPEKFPIAKHAKRALGQED